MTPEQQKQQRKSNAWSNALNFGSNLLGSALSLWGQKKSEERQHEYNKEQMALNFMYNEKAAQNADERQRAQYNDLYSFAAQKAQMKQAGLSPALMYGGGGVGGSGSAQGNMSAGANGMAAPQAINSMLSFAALSKQIAETKLINAQAQSTEDNNKRENQKQPAILEQLGLQNAGQKATNAGIELDNALKGLQIDWTKQTWDINYKTLQANLNNIEQATLKIIEETAKTKEEAERIKNLAVEEVKKMQAETTNIQANTDKTNTEINQINAQTLLTKAQVNLTEEQTNQVQKSIEKLDTEIDKIGFDKLNQKMLYNLAAKEFKFLTQNEKNKLAIEFAKVRGKTIHGNGYNDLLVINAYDEFYNGLDWELGELKIYK